MFRRYHYLNNDIHNAAMCFCATVNGAPVGFCAVLHQPHKVINTKRCSRLVVLPDWQGVGIGFRLLETVARYFDEKGFVFNIATSAKNLISKLNRSSSFRCFNFGVSKYTMSTKSKIDYYTYKGRKTVCDRKMASFRFVGKSKNKFNK